jgi:hypothetical protein
MNGDRADGGGALQFSLKALIITVAVVAALMGAYRAGYEAGSVDGFERAVRVETAVSSQPDRPIESLPSSEEWQRITREHPQR